jgi:AcrR family transcriptional regulator
MTSPRRRVGRPPVRSPDLRGRILDAAIALLATRGYHATPLRAIATKARVTPALVHYYFGTKATLLDALIGERIVPVFMQATAPLREASEGQPLDVPAQMRAYITTLFANPWLPQILVREVLSEGGALRERFLRQFAVPTASMLPAHFAEGQRQGLVRADLDPRLLALSLMSLLIFPVVGAPVWRRALPFAEGEVTPEVLVAHTLAVFRHGVEPRSA